MLPPNSLVSYLLISVPTAHSEDECQTAVGLMGEKAISNITDKSRSPDKWFARMCFIYYINKIKAKHGKKILGMVT